MDYNLAGLDMAQTENKCIEFSIQIMDIRYEFLFPYF